MQINKDLVPILKKISNLGTEFADVRHVDSESTQLIWTPIGIKSISQSHLHGYGARTYTHNRCYFASTSGFDGKNLPNILRKSIRPTESANQTSISDFSLTPVSDSKPLGSVVDPRVTSVETKIDYLEQMGEILKTYFNGFIFTEIHYMDQVISESVVNTFGSEVTSQKSLIQLILRVTIKEQGSFSTAISTIAREGGVEVLDKLIHQEYGTETLDMAKRLLKTTNFSNNNISAILNQDIAGVLLHEAIGHSIEADHVLDGFSPLKDKLMQPITSDEINIFDYPNFDRTFGSYSFDSEATPSQKTIVVKNGVLMNFLHSLETASQMNTTPTGNGRAHTFMVMPIPRSSTLYLSPGDWTTEEMIRETPYGVYVEGIGGNCDVELSTGKFSVTAHIGTIIKNGKLQETVKNPTIQGNILETLRDIDAIGKESQLAVTGYCIKKGQVVPSNSCCPPIKVNKIQVNGSSINASS